MAKMHPEQLSEYTRATESERIVFNALKTQLPDSFDVFYSVGWTERRNGQFVKSEADFIVTSQEYGFLCLEVKGGDGIRVDGNDWYLIDHTHGDRKLRCSPYEQAEKNMYYFKSRYAEEMNTRYPGTFASGVLYPFFAIPSDMDLDNRHRDCTIDCEDMNNLFFRIKKIFKLAAGSHFGHIYIPDSQHKAFLQMILSRVAISAAAGALVKYKDQQLETINRVQDNYIYFLSNVRQFYIRGGAGTGKTFIAKKMAEIEKQNPNKKVLFLCASKELARMMAANIEHGVEVQTVASLFQSIAEDPSVLSSPQYVGVSSNLKKDLPQYDAIFIDEAQDFTQEWASVIPKLLKDKENSRLGVFYDDVQIFRADSFGDGFGIKSLPYLLRENIRNTANIYSWASESTNLGKEVITNPVEGPAPVTEYLREQGALTLYLENTFKKFIEDEGLSSSSLVLLTDDPDRLFAMYPDGIAKWQFVTRRTEESTKIHVSSVENFKGLESDMVIYLHREDTSVNQDYIAYTRAKYYLIELILDF